MYVCSGHDGLLLAPTAAPASRFVWLPRGSDGSENRPASRLSNPEHNTFMFCVASSSYGKSCIPISLTNRLAAGRMSLPLCEIVTLCPKLADTGPRTYTACDEGIDTFITDKSVPNVCICTPGSPTIASSTRMQRSADPAWSSRTTCRDASPGNRACRSSTTLQQKVRSPVPPATVHSTTAVVVLASILELAPSQEISAQDTQLTESADSTKKAARARNTMNFNTTVVVALQLQVGIPG